jgi:hypothetical protein
VIGLCSIDRLVRVLNTSVKQSVTLWIGVGNPLIRLALDECRKLKSSYRIGCSMPLAFAANGSSDGGRPGEDGEMDRFDHYIGLTHTQRYHAHYRTTRMGHVYQGRFKSGSISR